MLPLFGRSRRLVGASLVAFAVSLSGAPLSASPASRSVERFEVKVSDSNVKAGAARVLARAPSATLRSVVTDYGRYSSIITQFKQARVLGRKDAQTDVYLEVPILEGAGKVWAVVRFTAPEIVGNEEIVRGRLVKGNVKRLDATWRIKKVDDSVSELSLELLIVPDLPAPKSLITKELRKAAGKAVNSARNEAERRNRA